ncbi:MAG TPA: TolC family protein [Candidatus Baltobacteraceae bacterium]
MKTFLTISMCAFAVVSTSVPAFAQAVPQLPASAVTQRTQAGIPQQVTLQQAVDIAVEKSPVLAAARANLAITQIPVQLAHSAILPNVSANASVTHNNSATFQGRSFGSNTSRGLTADVRQLIYDGGKVIAQLHQARANALAGTNTYDRQLQTLAFNVAQSYYAELQAHSATLLAKQVVHQNEVQEALVQAQLRAGTASRVDLATAQLPTAQARVALVRAQGQEATALAAFANTLGLDADVAVAPAQSSAATSTATQVPVLSYDQAVRRAMLLRPDYLAAQSTTLAAKYNVQVQRSGLYPTLTANGTYGTNSTSAIGTNFAPSSSIGATLSIPIFDQGITRAQTEQAQAQLDLAQSQLDQTRLGVELNVRQTLVGLVTAQGAVAQAQAELAKAQEILKATQAQYRAGVTTLPLLLNAQVGLTQAETDELNAVYGLRQAEQTYVYALGESTLTTP